VTLTAPELSRLRTDFRATLGDTGRAVRLAGTPAFNTTTGTYTGPADTTVYSGPCRVMPRAQGETLVNVGDQPITLRVYDVSLPHDATGIKVDDYWVTDTAADAELVGRRLRVLNVGWSSVQAGRRLVCQDVLG
jgi:hypothetical protein